LFAVSAPSAPATKFIAVHAAVHIDIAGGYARLRSARSRSLSLSALPLNKEITLAYAENAKRFVPFAHMQMHPLPQGFVGKLMW